MTEKKLIQIACQAIDDVGGPLAMNRHTIGNVMGFLRTLASSDAAALHAFAAGMAQAQALAAGIRCRIDVDRCTDHMVALIEPDGTTRHIPLAAIELIVSAAADVRLQQSDKTTTNTPIAAPHANTLH